MRGRKKKVVGIVALLGILLLAVFFIIGTSAPTAAPEQYPDFLAHALDATGSRRHPSIKAFVTGPGRYEVNHEAYMNVHLPEKLDGTLVSITEVCWGDGPCESGVIEEQFFDFESSHIGYPLSHTYKKAGTYSVVIKVSGKAPEFSKGAVRFNFDVTVRPDDGVEPIG